MDLSCSREPKVQYHAGRTRDERDIWTNCQRNTQLTPVPMHNFHHTAPATIAATAPTATAHLAFPSFFGAAPRKLYGFGVELALALGAAVPLAALAVPLPLAKAAAVALGLEAKLR